MVNFGFPFVSTTFSRVSTVLSRDVVLGNMRSLQEELLRLGDQLSSGVRLTTPSIDPIASTRVLDFTARVAENERFVKNIERVQSRMDRVDAIADETHELIDKATTIALEQAQGTSTSQTRLIASQEVGQLLRRAMSLANTSFEGRFLFGGTATTRSVVTSVGGSVLFEGNTRETNFRASAGLTVRENVSADALFGVLSEGILGEDASGNPVDLDPILVGGTRLSDLNGGDGVPPGVITIAGPTGTADVDLRLATDLQDVIDLINQQTANTGVTAAFNAAFTGIDLTAGGAISVADAPGGRTAERLGIDTNGVLVASPILGTDLDPLVTERTPLTALLGGVGLTLSGITVSNAVNGTTIVDALSFAGLSSVGDVLRTINQSTAFVTARINEGGTGIDVRNRISGGRMGIGENGGTTAAELGLRYTLSRARVVDLNGGLGLGTVDGADIRFDLHDGTSLSLDIDPATTMRDLVDLIVGTGVLSAALLPTNQFRITDLTAGAATFTVQDTNGSFAATNLDIASSTAAFASISGAPLTYVGVPVEGLFTALATLRDGLLANNVDAIARSRKLLARSQEIAENGRSEAGARLAAIEFTRNRVEQQNEDLKKFISQDKDVDLAEAASAFATKQTVFQAALNVSARLLQTSLLNFL